MDFFECARNVLKYFKLVGLSSFNSEFSVHVSHQRKAFKRFYINGAILLQATFNAILCIFVIYHVHYLVILQKSFKTAYIVMTSLFVFGQFSRTICTLGQCIFYEQTICNILECFQQIESYFFIHLNHYILYKDLRKRYNSKLLTILLSQLNYFIISLITYVIRKRLRPLDHEIHCLQFLSILTHMHAIFYVEAIHFHLDQLILLIERDTAYSTNKYFRNKYRMSTMYFRAKLKNYKVIYFRLWKVSEQINEYFGWYFVVIIIELFFELVYASYWLIQVLTRIEKRLLLPRK